MENGGVHGDEERGEGLGEGVQHTGISPVGVQHVACVSVDSGIRSVGVWPVVVVAVIFSQELLLLRMEQGGSDEAWLW